MKHLLRVAALVIAVGVASPAFAFWSNVTPGEPVLPNDKAQWRINQFEVRQQWASIGYEDRNISGRYVNGAWRDDNRAMGDEHRMWHRHHHHMMEPRAERVEERNERVADRTDNREPMRERMHRKWEHAKARVENKTDAMRDDNDNDNARY